MKLSVIIVNYNVKHFLEQCLHSVLKASKNVAAEVFVVDNNSVDGSVEMVKEKFPSVKIIDNKKNLGFSKANNQAIRVSCGEYVLLLNPDTVVEEDTFEKVCRFMDEHADAGGLGVKMLDGKGNFLPESKRGLPTPSVAFYKIFGLAALFPRSRTFGKYHLGFLDKDKTHEVDVLSGAFMLLRKSALDKVGLLDEDFFMYGEDIDMSYRITKGGFKNYYFPGTRIIHYKGESTKKSSVNYVFVFYNAMMIFAGKHFSQSNARLFSFFIKIAIYLRAGAAIISRFVKAMLLPLTDAALIFAGMYGIKYYYEHYFRFTEGGAYPPEFILYVVPSYIIIWLFTVYLSGGYDRPIRLSRIIRGIAVGTAAILVIYALLPESLRFSRALILLGAGGAIISMMGLRMVLHLLNIKKYRLDSAENKRLIIAGSEPECERVNALLKQTALKISFAGFVSIDEKVQHKENHLGNLAQLADIIDIYKIDEVIFCAKDITAQTIIDTMLLPEGRNVDYKIAPPESLSVIGSNSIETSGDMYTIDINSISKSANKRNKRLVDITTGLVLIPSLPITIFIVRSPFNFIKNIFSVLFGVKTWVGYNKANKNNEFHTEKLPVIKPGVLFPSDILKNKTINAETAERLNLLYAKDYRAWNDLNIIMRGIRMLGRA